MTCARWFSSRGGRIVSNSSLRTKMIRCSSAAYVPTLSLSNHFFFFICRLIYSRHPISLGNELLLTWNWRVNDGFFQSSLLILVQRSVKETRGKWILCKLVSVHGRSSLEIAGRFLTTPPAILNQGGTSTRPTPPRDFWRMNQGNVAPWFSEQAVTWNTARSDFLPVSPPRSFPIPQPAGYPFKR